VCVCVRACMYACMLVYVCMCVCAHLRACLHASVPKHILYKHACTHNQTKKITPYRIFFLVTNALEHSQQISSILEKPWKPRTHLTDTGVRLLEVLCTKEQVHEQAAATQGLDASTLCCLERQKSFLLWCRLCESFWLQKEGLCAHKRSHQQRASRGRRAVCDPGWVAQQLPVLLEIFGMAFQEIGAAFQKA